MPNVSGKPSDDSAHIIDKLRTLENLERGYNTKSDDRKIVHIGKGGSVKFVHAAWAFFSFLARSVGHIFDKKINVPNLELDPQKSRENLTSKIKSEKDDIRSNFKDLKKLSVDELKEKESLINEIDEKITSFSNVETLFYKTLNPNDKTVTIASEWGETKRVIAEKQKLAIAFTDVENSIEQISDFTKLDQIKGQYEAKKQEAKTLDEKIHQRRLGGNLPTEWAPRMTDIETKLHAKELVLAQKELNNIARQITEADSPEKLAEAVKNYRELGTRALPELNEQLSVLGQQLQEKITALKARIEQKTQENSAQIATQATDRAKVHEPAEDKERDLLTNLAKALSEIKDHEVISPERKNIIELATKVLDYVQNRDGIEGQKLKKEIDERAQALGLTTINYTDFLVDLQMKVKKLVTDLQKDSGYIRTITAVNLHQKRSEMQNTSDLVAAFTRTKKVWNEATKELLQQLKKELNDPTALKILESLKTDNSLDIDQVVRSFQRIERALQAKDGSILDRLVDLLKKHNEGRKDKEVMLSMLANVPKEEQIYHYRSYTTETLPQEIQRAKEKDAIAEEHQRSASSIKAELDVFTNRAAIAQFTKKDVAELPSEQEVKDYIRSLQPTQRGEKALAELFLKTLVSFYDRQAYDRNVVKLNEWTQMEKSLQTAAEAIKNLIELDSIATTSDDIQKKIASLVQENTQLQAELVELAKLQRELSK